MRIDKLVMHADDVKEGSGAEFYGTPIREASYLAVDVREEIDTGNRIRMSLGEPSAPIELLPSEVITGEIIRRGTASEVLGEAFYKKDVVMDSGRKVSIEEAMDTGGVLITWRPNNQEFAFIHDEVAQ